CDLLEARMKVTTDILHMRPPSSRALGLKQIKFTQDAAEAVVVMQSNPRQRARAFISARVGVRPCVTQKVKLYHYLKPKPADGRRHAGGFFVGGFFVGKNSRTKTAAVAAGEIC
ncbi:MAG: hypothetical protein LAO78_24840, partial [Acidobacteriia bacterium]|nr:hypothetical protein [Terriglobia bacterium]